LKESKNNVLLDTFYFKRSELCWKKI
jgi:hypothetical protein